MPPARSPPPPVVGSAGVAGRTGESGPPRRSTGPNGLASEKPPSSQVMKMAEWLVQALLWVISPTHCCRKALPSWKSLAWAGDCGDDGYGQAGAPPCMSSQMFGEIHANC